jgi:hypothetical protein
VEIASGKEYIGMAAFKDVFIIQWKQSAEYIRVQNKGNS